MTENVDFTYLTHVDSNRRVDDHGIYLDDVQRRNAEIQRAKVEGREPDLDNPPSTVSTPMLPTSVVKSNFPGDMDVPVSANYPVDKTEVVSVPTTTDSSEPEPDTETSNPEPSNPETQITSTLSQIPLPPTV